MCNICSTQSHGWANSALSACWQVMPWWRSDTHLTWIQPVDFVFCSPKWNCPQTRWSQDMEDMRSITAKLNTFPLNAFHDSCSSCRKIRKMCCKRSRLLRRKIKKFFFLFCICFRSTNPRPLLFDHVCNICTLLECGRYSNKKHSHMQF